MSTNYRIDHPRRAMPTLRVFHNFELVFEQDIYREDVPAIRAHLDANLADVENYSTPRVRIRELVLAAT